MGRFDTGVFRSKRSMTGHHLIGLDAAGDVALSSWLEMPVSAANMVVLFYVYTYAALDVGLETNQTRQQKSMGQIATWVDERLYIFIYLQDVVPSTLTVDSSCDSFPPTIPYLSHLRPRLAQP